MIKINSVLGRILITLYFTWVFKTHIYQPYSIPFSTKLDYQGYFYSLRRTCMKYIIMRDKPGYKKLF